MSERLDGMWRELEVSVSGVSLPISAWRCVDRRAVRRGLLGESEWRSDQALLLSGALVIHTIGMRVPLDLIWVRAGRIVRISRGVQPGGVRLALAWTVFELGEGGVEAFNLKEGDQIEWRDSER